MSLSLKFIETRVYEPQIRARLGTFPPESPHDLPPSERDMRGVWVGFSPSFRPPIRGNPTKPRRYCLPYGLWIIPSGLFEKPLCSPL